MAYIHAFIMLHIQSVYVCTYRYNSNNENHNILSILYKKSSSIGLLDSAFGLSQLSRL